MQTDAKNASKQTGYIKLDELEMYYEQEGDGPPLLLLHGGLIDIAMSFDKLWPDLTRNRRVIAVEQQAHGHTADIDRPLRFKQMADDTAAVMEQLGIDAADVFGFSDGGNVALGLAIRHPERVKKLMVAGTNFNNDGLVPGLLKMFHDPDPDAMPKSMRERYEQVAPRPEDWKQMIYKGMELAASFEGWTPEQLRGIKVPALVMAGDADIITPEHAVALYRLLPKAQLAVLPGTTHDMIHEHSEWVLGMLEAFLNAEPKQAQRHSFETTEESA